MDRADIDFRNLTYRLFVDRGRAPRADEVAREAGTAPADVVASWRRLHEQHAVVLEPDRDEIRMANPFSAVPTRFRVQAAGRTWDANCAWDAFGICVAMHVGGRIDTACPDCDEPITVNVRDEGPDREDLVFHCPLPAARWWDDIVFT
jgi:hypothetical protein